MNDFVIKSIFFLYYFSYMCIPIHKNQYIEQNIRLYMCVIDEHEMANINSICWTIRSFCICICLLYMKRYNWFHLDLFCVHVVCVYRTLYNKCSFCSVTNIPLFLLRKYRCWIQFVLKRMVSLVDMRGVFFFLCSPYEISQLALWWHINGTYILLFCVLPRLASIYG